MIVAQGLRKVFLIGHVALADASFSVEAMKASKVDAAYFGPFSYVLAAQVADDTLYDPIRETAKILNLDLSQIWG